MSKLREFCETCSPWFLSLMRIVLAALFICHGTQKVFDYPEMKMDPPDLTSLLGIGGMIEIAFGSLLLLGLFARLAAFILCGEMAVAYFTVHFKRAWWPIHNGGELALVYCFVFLYFCAAGAGPLSLDKLFFGRRSEETEEAE